MGTIAPCSRKRCSVCSCCARCTATESSSSSSGAVRPHVVPPSLPAGHRRRPSLNPPQALLYGSRSPPDDRASHAKRTGQRETPTPTAASTPSPSSIANTPCRRSVGRAKVDRWGAAPVCRHRRWGITMRALIGRPAGKHDAGVSAARQINRSSSGPSCRAHHRPRRFSLPAQQTASRAALCSAQPPACQTPSRQANRPGGGLCASSGSAGRIQRGGRDAVPGCAARALAPVAPLRP